MAAGHFQADGFALLGTFAIIVVVTAVGTLSGGQRLEAVASLCGMGVSAQHSSRRNHVRPNETSWIWVFFCLFSYKKKMIYRMIITFKTYLSKYMGVSPPCVSVYHV